MLMLQASVGQNGANNPIDVKLVQLLLNDWLGRQQKILLKLDGIAGPLTNGAIAQFQAINGLPRDGRVDPHGPTIKALVDSHLNSMREAMLQTPGGRKIIRYSNELRVNTPPLEMSSLGDLMTTDPVEWYLGVLRSNLS